MATSELKLMISTALNNAGIKATQAQLQGLQKELISVNNSATKTSGVFGAFEKGLSVFPPVVGKAVGSMKLLGTGMQFIGKGITSMLGPIGLIVIGIQAFIEIVKTATEAFSTVRKWLGENVSDFFKSDAEKQEEALKKMQAVKNNAEKMIQSSIRLSNKKIEKLEEEKNKITELDKVMENHYQKEIGYLNRVRKLKTPAEELDMLDREIRDEEEVARVRNANGNEAADQLELYLKYQRQKIQLERQMQSIADKNLDIDKEEQKIQQQIQAKDNQIATAENMVYEAKSRLDRMDPQHKGYAQAQLVLRKSKKHLRQLMEGRASLYDNLMETSEKRDILRMEYAKQLKGGTYALDDTNMALMANFAANGQFLGSGGSGYAADVFMRDWNSQRNEDSQRYTQIWKDGNDIAQDILDELRNIQGGFNR